MQRKIVKAIIPIFAIRVVTSILYCILNAMLYIRMSRLVDLALEGNDSINNEILLLIFNACVLMLCGLIDSKVYGRFIRNVSYQLKSNYVELVAKSELNEFGKAERVSIYINDVNSLVNQYFDGIDTLMNCLVSIGTSLWMLTETNIYVVICSLILSIVALLCSAKLLEKVDASYGEVSKKNAELIKHIRDTLGGFLTIKSYSIERKMISRYLKAVEELKEARNYTGNLNSKIFLLQSLVMNLAVYGTLIVTGIMVYLGMLGVGSIMLTVEAISRFVSSIADLSAQIGNVVATKTIWERVEKAIKTSETEKVFRNIELVDEIECRSLQVTYNNKDKENKVFDAFTYRFLKGEKYLVCGESGSGKSTLLNAILGEMTISNGAILWNGVEVGSISKKDVFTQVAVVSQEPFIFDDTIYNNITMYHQYSEKDISKVVDMAGLSEYIAGLEKGIYTHICGNGNNLSGGEKTRIALARALLKKCSVLILDEIYASLDDELAKTIESNILQMKDVLVISVSHVIFNENREKYTDIIKLECR